MPLLRQLLHMVEAYVRSLRSNLCILSSTKTDDLESSKLFYWCTGSSKSDPARIEPKGNSDQQGHEEPVDKCPLVTE